MPTIKNSTPKVTIQFVEDNHDSEVKITIMHPDKIMTLPRDIFVTRKEAAEMLNQLNQFNPRVWDL